jgi:hypothetical protein
MNMMEIDELMKESDDLAGDRVIKDYLKAGGAAVRPSSAKDTPKLKSLDM